jgi:hypothetical protein
MMEGALVTSTACGAVGVADPGVFAFDCAREPPHEAETKPSAATKMIAARVLTRPMEVMI